MIPQITTIVAIGCISCLSMWLIPEAAKEIGIAAVAGLVGYLKGKEDGRNAN